MSSILENWIKHKYETRYDVPCSCCMTTGRRLKFIPDGPGFVCRQCYLQGARCSVLGCNEPACRDGAGKCRDHYVGDYHIDFNRVYGTGNSAIAQCQDFGWIWDRNDRWHDK